MTIRIDEFCRRTSITLICIYLYFYQFFEAFDVKMIGLSMLSIALLMNIFTVVMQKHQRRPMLQRVSWVYFLIILLFHNEYIKLGNYGSVLLPITALSVVLLFASKTKWIGFTYKTLIALGMIHVSATILFACSNALYLKIMPAVWGYFPVGTRGGLNGAAAGLTRHYSYNGIYCSLVFILACSAMITKTLGKRQRIWYVVATGMAFIAVLITQKRAHLLFGIAAVVLTYITCGYYKGLKKIQKMILGGICAALLFGIAVLFVPSLGGTLERFVALSSDQDISTGRFAAWRVGIELFKESPAFGKGWFYFPVFYNRSEFPEIHNIYIQFLCELGIIGAVMMCFAMYGTLFKCIQVFRQNRNEMLPEQRRGLSMSIGYQLFVAMYGMTGCCLTDITVIAYLLMVGVGCAICEQYRGKGMKKLQGR